MCVCVCMYSYVSNGVMDTVVRGVNDSLKHSAQGRSDCALTGMTPGIHVVASWTEWKWL